VSTASKIEWTETTWNPTTGCDRISPGCDHCIGTSIESDEYCWRADELRRANAAVRFLSCEPLLGPLPSLDLTGIGWVIVGRESGPNFGRLDLDWVRDLRDRCVSLRTPLFFQQVGGLSPKAGRLLDARVWNEFPTGW
jgi:protein gp37